MTSNHVVAIACADLHLSDKPPIARSEEIKNDPNGWYKAMKRPLIQLRKIWEEHKRPPILYVGDIFHHWNSSATLINFAIRFLPKGYCIAGQHDLPYHSYEHLERSAFYTLVRSNKLINLSMGGDFITDQIYVRGFGWEVEPQKPHLPDPRTIKRNPITIALIHRYIWSTDNTKHPKAKDTDYVNNLPKELLTYDFVISGDNHITFAVSRGQTTFLNCGSLMARNSDQRNHCPFLHLIYSDGRYTVHPLNISKDKWIDPAKVPIRQEHEDIKKLAKIFKRLKSKPFDFLGDIANLIKHEEIEKGVKKVLRETLEKVKNDIK